jgi:hypothetical protein
LGQFWKADIGQVFASAEVSDTSSPAGFNTKSDHWDMKRSGVY